MASRKRLHLHKSREKHKPHGTRFWHGRRNNHNASPSADCSLQARVRRTCHPSICRPADAHKLQYNHTAQRTELGLADGRIDFDTAKQQFNQIISSDRQSKAAVLLMVALANASFCRLFGGDAAAMAIVGIATLCGYYIKAVLVERGIDIRAVFIICALVSSILGATDILFPHGSTPYIAVATSVLYLVPGIPFLNSFSDLLHRHYICAFSRFADAVILTGCLSAGLCGGMLLMKIGMF